MNPILAIAAIAIRSAIRSRVVVGLLLILLGAVIGLPATIRGDGTLAGYVQILLEYTLGAVFWILALATLWAGCGAVAHDIDTKVIHMVVTKPVSRLQLWTGKWLGLLTLNTALLVLSVLCTYGLLQWNLRHRSFVEPTAVFALPTTADDLEAPEEPDQAAAIAETLLQSRRVFSPPTPDVEADANAYLDEQLQRGAVPEELTREQALREVRRMLLVQANAVSPGGAGRWTLQPTPAYRNDLPVTFRFRFALSRLEADVVNMRWTFTSGEREVTVVKPAVPSAINEVDLPADLIASGRPLTVRYANAHEPPTTVIFDVDHGIELLVPVGSFEGNLVRASLILFGQLAMFTAIGVTAGCLFSYPVAAFLSLFVIVLTQLTGYIQGLAGGGGSAPLGGSGGGLMGFLLSVVFLGLHALLKPITLADPLSALATGKHIAWAEAGSTLLFQLVILSAVLGLLSAWVLNRRELGAPQT